MDQIVSEIKEWKIMAVDTELRVAEQRTIGSSILLIVQIGSHMGNVMIFRDYREIPQTVKDLLEDWTICKIQSNIIEDIYQLSLIGIRCTGFVDTQLIKAVFINGEISGPVGTDAQVFDSGFRPYPFVINEEKGFKCTFDVSLDKSLPEYEVLHASQDVRIPFVTLLIAAKRRAETRQEKNVLAVAHEILSLLRGKITPDELPSFPSANGSFLPAMSVADSTKTACVNTLEEVIKIRRALSSFIEPIWPNIEATPTVQELTKIPLKFWSNRELPNRDQCSNPNLIKAAGSRCTVCGCPDHNFQNCPSGAMLCTYPACQDRKNHSVLMCQELHFYCFKCRHRGHRKFMHQKFSPRELDNIFARNSHKGFVTSVPFLEMVEDQRKRVVTYHWLCSLYKESLPMSNPVAHRFGIIPILRLADDKWRPHVQNILEQKVQRRTELTRATQPKIVTKEKYTNVD